MMKRDASKKALVPLFSEIVKSVSSYSIKNASSVDHFKAKLRAFVVKCQEVELKPGEEIKKIRYKKHNLLTLSAEYNQVDLVEKLVSGIKVLGATIKFNLTDFNWAGKSALCVALEKGREAIILVQWIAGQLSAEQFADLDDKAQAATKRFLRYSPWKDEKRSIKRFPSLSSVVEAEHRNNMVADYYDTSEDEDSDNEFDLFHTVRTINPDSVDLQLSRGFHFARDRFNAAQRRKVRKYSYHSNSEYSPATLELARSYPDVVLDKELQADRVVKDYFSTIKGKDDKKETDSKGKVKSPRKVKGEPKDFKSLYHRLVHVYVNKDSEKYLFTDGAIKRNFDFPISQSPFISTSSNLKIAFDYAACQKSFPSVSNSNFMFKMRRSTLALKHRRIGFVRIYVVDQKEMQGCITDINGLSRVGEIGVSHNYSFNDEYLIQSSVPSQFILGYQMVSVPKFDVEWSAEMLSFYGLNKVEYQQYQNAIKATAKNRGNLNNVMKMLMKKIIPFQADKLKKDVKHRMRIEFYWFSMQVLAVNFKPAVAKDKSITPKIQTFVTKVLEFLGATELELTRLFDRGLEEFNQILAQPIASSGVADVGVTEIAASESSTPATSLTLG